MTAASMETVSGSTPRMMQENTSSCTKSIANSWRKPARLNQNTSTQRETKMENEKIQNVLHVFDLIKDNLINAKIGKKVAEIIFEQGGTPEDIIKNIGLRKCIPDPNAVLDILNKFPDLLHRAQNGDDKAKHELVGQCMRQSGGKLNPNLVRQYIDNMEALVKAAEKEREAEIIQL